MKTNRQKKGFTLIEVLISLIVLAMIMTAVATAFNASAKNYDANEKIFKSVNMARQALTRITSRVRTAKAVELPDNEPANKCSIITHDDKVLTYDYRSEDQKLYLIDNTTSNEYLLCDNVTGLTFTKTTAIVREQTAVRSVMVALTVTLNGEAKTLSSAAVLRRNLD